MEGNQNSKEANDITLAKFKKIEKEVQKKPEPQIDNNFMVIPNDDTKRLIICPSIDNAIIELDMDRARVLVEIINRSIQKW